MPVAIALAWMPLRSSLPNTDVALVMVASIAPVAWIGGRIEVLAGGALAALAFDYLFTQPYGNLRVTHARDVVTTLLIVLVGVLVGELTLRMSAHRHVADRGIRDLAVLSETAELVATGHDAPLVVAAVGGELMRLLDLSDCEFVPEPPSGVSQWIERDGTVRCRRENGVVEGLLLDLPVWLQGQVFGCYRMTLRNPQVPPADRLSVAVSLADQAGAALAAGEVPPPDKPGRGRLRLVGSDDAAPEPVVARSPGSAGRTRGSAALPPTG